MIEQRRIIGLILEVGVLVAMGSHCSEFAGKFFLQCLGGPIGLAITALLASITMKCFDNLWIKLLESNNVKYLTYVRNADDSRNFMTGLRKGVRWSKGKVEYQND